jgi:hypothetical protein
VEIMTNKEKYPGTGFKFMRRRDRHVGSSKDANTSSSNLNAIELAQAQLDRIKIKEAVIEQIKNLIDSE